MGDPWEKLTDEEKDAISASAVILGEDEINERFSVQDDKVLFRVYRKVPGEVAWLGEPGEEEAVEYEIAQEVPLISLEDFDYDPEITEEDRIAARPIDEALLGFGSYYERDLFWGEEAASESEADATGLPPVVDHRPNQSPIKYQGTRGTCVAHASTALIESYVNIPNDLSEQYAHYKFNEFLGRPHNIDSGLKTTEAPKYLSRADGRICLEKDWPCIPHQATINQLISDGTYGPPAAAQSNQTYGITSVYKIIPDEGLTGESIRNIRYLEALLHKGHNIVIGVYPSWNDKDNDGVLDPVLAGPGGKPIKKGGHAMLVVGYDRPSQYFIVKNSWGPDWGHEGYGYLHYNFIRLYAKYGYVIGGVIPPTAPPYL